MNLIVVFAAVGFDRHDDVIHSESDEAAGNREAAGAVTVAARDFFRIINDGVESSSDDVEVGALVDAA